MKHRSLLITVLMMSWAVPLAAQQRADSGAFIIRLGTDTIAVERYVRMGNRLVAEAVQRSPRTMVHSLTYEFDPQGRVTRATVVSRPPGGPAGQPRVVDAAGNLGAIPIGGPFYTPYQLAIAQWLRAGAGADSAVLLAGNNLVRIPLGRVGSDSVTLTNQFGEPMRVHVDAAGRLLHLHTPAFTTVERVPFFDLEAFAREFAARDTTGRGLGMLSPRHAYRTRVGEANIWVDYSRPGKRGRPVWGALVPWGRVWRMGANDAAHLATDKTIALGNLTLSPGTYTLYMIPEAGQWTVIVNRRTGVSGLDYDQSQDVGRVTAVPERVAQPAEQFTIGVNGNQEGGALTIGWDTLRATIPIRVP